MAVDPAADLCTVQVLNAFEFKEITEVQNAHLNTTWWLQVPDTSVRGNNNNNNNNNNNFIHIAVYTESSISLNNHKLKTIQKKKT